MSDKGEAVAAMERIRSPLVRTIKGLLYSRLPYRVSQKIDRLARPEMVPIAERAAAQARECQAIFIHIPKVAGMSVVSSLFGEGCFRGHKPIGTYMMALGRTEFESVYKFCFVRNPWDRVHSAYRYLSAGGMNQRDRAWARRELAGVAGFEGFVLHRLAQPGVQGFIHFRPQVEWITGPGGTMRVDMVGRFETLYEDFDKIRRRLGLPDTVRLRWKNKTQGKRRDYRESYTPEMVEVIADLYRRDVDSFRYTFDGRH